MRLPDQDLILAILDSFDRRLTSQELVRETCRQTGLTASRVRHLIRRLSDSGKVSYTYEFGLSFVERSFSRPVQVTDRFTLTPYPVRETPGLIPVILEPGIAFGTGRHPTTRLCLAAIEAALIAPGLLRLPSTSLAIDVGCGCGVLAIAMVKAGIHHCLAVDTDLNAVSETEKNVLLNSLEARITVKTSTLEELRQPACLIAANLRAPTLHNLMPHFRSSLVSGGLAILSGFRPSESEDILMAAGNHDFSPVWAKDENRWSALILSCTRS